MPERESSGILHVCEYCGSEFLTSKKGQRFCSRSCGSRLPRNTPLPEIRFWQYVNRHGPEVWEGHGHCWEWTGGMGERDYGSFSLSHTRQQPSHVFSYQLHYGPIPAGLEIDHLCRNHKCCRPDHLEVVTHRTNILRGVSLAALNAVKTHCKRGHPFDEANTSIGPHGQRTCRTCKREQQRSRRDKSAKA